MLQYFFCKLENNKKKTNLKVFVNKFINKKDKLCSIKKIKKKDSIKIEYQG